MPWPEPSARLRGHRPGLLPLLLAFLGMAGAEVQPLLPQEEQAPAPGGKGPLGEERGGVAVSPAEGCYRASRSQFPGLNPSRLAVVERVPLGSPGAQDGGGRLELGRGMKGSEPSLRGQGGIPARSLQLGAPGLTHPHTQPHTCLSPTPMPVSHPSVRALRKPTILPCHSCSFPKGRTAHYLATVTLHPITQGA